MPWNSIWPVQNVSVKLNGPTGRENTDYVQTSMNEDHFWNKGLLKDGHHKWAQMEATNDADKTLQTNPALATDMDLVYFTRYKTALESIVQQDSQPFAINQGSVAPFPQAVLQLLGIRAMVVFNSVPGNVAQTIVYHHNVTSVVRQIEGRFQITYASPLPSSNYLLIGGAMGNSANNVFTPMGLSVSSGASVAARKNALAAVFLTYAGAGTLTDGLQTWLICFGG